MCPRARTAIVTATEMSNGLKIGFPDFLFTSQPAPYVSILRDIPKYAESSKKSVILFSPFL